MSIHTSRLSRAFHDIPDGEDWWTSSAAFVAVDVVQAGPLADALVGIIEVLQEGTDPLWVVGGETFTQGVAVAQEWLDAGVDGREAGDWLRCGCWDPNAARAMIDVGLRPDRLLDHDGKPVHWIEVSNGDSMTVASAVADGFLTPDEAVRVVAGR